MTFFYTVYLNKSWSRIKILTGAEAHKIVADPHNRYPFAKLFAPSILRCMRKFFDR
jgi:hypothetical protein